MPTFVMVVDDFPMTPSNKVIKRELVLRRWHAVESDPSARVWWREGKSLDFVPFDAKAASSLRSRFEANNRGHVIS
jgi:hypothetical protein